ncbi:long-chain-fatty-acid--CoA ligase [Vitiosangium sp. GDMCC 1.1324]|uniref:long-chain-fatty-acid--CoA ligase n=1 Tax=Vitiosangium sp. (strain GDMCC 1.1324) TaxID=2138576 RepID=UPI000D35599F|nr:long-chain-fatty-acid--CoA ligase [Vitiosangium sp. GDMCC 1.1324]PTL85524.1 AMP-dependent synthetase [Vitiosangium sp. GDMCC 1.1324]
MSLIREVMTLAELPTCVSRHHGQKTALLIQDESLDYEALERQSNKMAQALLQEGIRPGERIAVLGKESLDSLALLFGTAKARAVYVNINWRLSVEEIAYILGDASPRLLFVDGESLPLVSRLLERLAFQPKVITLSAAHPSWPSASQWLSSASDSAPGLTYDPDEVVVQLYTSGTTGHPKGVQLASRSFFAVAREMDARGEQWLGWTERTVYLSFVPTFHIGGLWALARGLALGSTCILLRTFNAAAILQAIPRYRVTKLCAVPAMLQVLMIEPGIQSADLSSLETVVYGGSPISPALLERAMELFGCGFCQLYGMTETGNVAVCMRPEDHRGAHHQRLRAAGRPLPGVEVRILDERRNELGAGSVGEIALKSPARMVGYWKQPEASAKTMVDGWVLTGDAGYRDEEGFVYVCDRLKDMIICAGENIYPAEIENVVRSQEGVADVAVIGIPDELWGETVKAIVVPRPGFTLRPGDIMRHARSHLAEFKVPKSVDFVEQLPRNASGKLLKEQLRRPYWQGRERRVN